MRKCCNNILAGKIMTFKGVTRKIHFCHSSGLSLREQKDIVFCHLAGKIMAFKGLNTVPQFNVKPGHAIKGTVAVTFDEFFNIFILCINYSFLFYSPKHVETPSIWLVNTACICIQYRQHCYCSHLNLSPDLNSEQ